MAEMMELYQQAENSVLGVLIAEAEVNAAEVFSRVKPEDFVTGISRSIFETCREMYRQGDAIDPLTVKAACGTEYMAWLKELEQITPSSRYCTAYVDKLLELSKRYRLQKLFREALDQNLAGVPMEELIGKVECMNEVLAADNDRRSRTMKDLIFGFFSRVGQKRTFLDWGFDELNRYVKVKRKHYVVIGARPSAGKTAFALQTAMYMAQKHSVTFFSLETDEETIEDRIMAAAACIDMAHIQSGELSEDELRMLVEKKSTLLDRNFHFYEATGITAEEIRAVTNRNKSDVIVIDYLQLIRARGRHKDEYGEITEITKALQRLAKSGVCVIALSQLSRGGQGMSALRGSGQIEQDADVVMMLDYPDEDDIKSEEEKADFKADRLRVIDIVKNKNGRRGPLQFWFFGAQQRFLAQWKGFYQTQLRMMEDEADASA